MPQENILHTQLSARRGAWLCRRTAVPAGHQRGRARPADHRGARRAGADPARRDPDVRAVRRPAEARQRGPGAADQAVAAVPGRADLRPRSRPRHVGDGDDGRAWRTTAGPSSWSRTAWPTWTCATGCSCWCPAARWRSSGRPADGLRHFGQPGWAQVFRAFEAEPDRDWAGEYRRLAVLRPVRHRGQAAGPAKPRRPAGGRRRRRGRSNRLAQMSTLVRRYSAVIASDRNYVAAIALLPVILGGLVRAVPAAQGLTGRTTATRSRCC